MPKKKPQKGKPEMHKDLDGFELNINEFGEITSNMSQDKLNEFLNKNVEDKKFKERDDQDLIKEKGSFKDAREEDEEEENDDVLNLEEVSDEELEGSTSDEEEEEN